MVGIFHRKRNYSVSLQMRWIELNLSRRPRLIVSRVGRGLREPEAILVPACCFDKRFSDRVQIEFSKSIQADVPRYLGMHQPPKFIKCDEYQC